MPSVEFNSPLTGSQMAPNFTITGASDAPAMTVVTCTATGGGLPQAPATTFTGAVDASGNWSTTTSLAASATAYTITATATGCGSDEVYDVTVQDNPNVGIDPVPPPPMVAGDARGATTYTITGTFVPVDPTDVLSTLVLVILHVFKGKKRSVAFSAGYATLIPVDGVWQISLPGPPANDTRRVVIQCIRLNAASKVLDHTSRKKT